MVMRGPALPNPLVDLMDTDDREEEEEEEEKENKDEFNFNDFFPVKPMVNDILTITI